MCGTVHPVPVFVTYNIPNYCVNYCNNAAKQQQKLLHVPSGFLHRCTLCLSVHLGPILQYTRRTHHVNVNVGGFSIEIMTKVSSYMHILSNTGKLLKCSVNCTLK